ncbi:uncharacterized protein LOC116178377 [Photinus pyralis]|uniref:uncharacterized protein LOC116178377 n=1 Tax=Photinus pyralis TaxID=7054 RepID=UPI001267821B|nr:uncharacterized protein LOC116178377 [Photinus pyralis]
MRNELMDTIPKALLYTEKKKKTSSSSEEESEASDATDERILEYPQPPKRSRQLQAVKDNSQDIVLENQSSSGIQKLDQIEAPVSSLRALRELQSQTPTTSVSRCSTPQYTVNADEDFKSKLFKELSFIKVHLIKVSQRLSALEENLNSSSKTEADDDHINNDFEEIIKNQFPLQLEADLQNMERQLTENPDLKKFMVSYCSSFGGHKVDEVTKIILKKLLSNKLAGNYSWLGAKKKMSFSGLQIAEVILSAVKRNKSLVGATEKDVIDSIKNWLRHAAARYSNQWYVIVACMFIYQEKFFSNYSKKNQNQEIQ